MYLIRYLASRESDRAVREETIDAPSIEDAAKHARSRVDATHVAAAVEPPEPIIGFLIFDAATKRLLHREYPFV
ncbi:MAG TPA: hypothetical protein VG651_04750 [Stellaceae bacterium]|nr:hypothetical protein [Stellaceae bacterium]